MNWSLKYHLPLSPLIVVLTGHDFLISKCPAVEQLLKNFSTSERETISRRNHENETFRENNRKCFRDANMSQNYPVGKNQILVSDWLLEQAHCFVPASQLRKSPRGEITCCKKRINTCREIPQLLGDWITIFFFIGFMNLTRPETQLCSKNSRTHLT